MYRWIRIPNWHAGILLLALSSATIGAEAQVPDKFTNLQYFPKDISRQQLIGTMRGFCFSLNVRCEFCHAMKSANNLEQMDFASDEKETKKTARAMLKMVDAINHEHIAKMGRTAPVRVECVTCHHRLSIPKTMDALLAETIDKKGVQAALALYRDLRERDFGGGQYDFGETPLNVLTESLLSQGKTKEAAAIMELNVGVNTPPSLWSYNLLAMAHMANKETEKAKADYQKILELNPQDAFAKKQLEELSGKR